MTATAPVIREYRPGDGEGLRALWIAVGFRLIADDEAGLAGFAARNPGTLLVAEANDRIIGSAMGAWDGRRGWLYHVAVVAEHRRLRLASDLVRRVEDGLRQVGCLRVLVIVENGNAPALAFWQSLGYELRDTAQLGKQLVP